MSRLASHSKNDYCVQGDELTDRFLRLLTQTAVTLSLKEEAAPPAGPRPQTLQYTPLDAYVRLLCILITGAPLIPAPLSPLPPEHTVGCSVKKKVPSLTLPDIP